jgi:hypothetical protein
MSGAQLPSCAPCPRPFFDLPWDTREAIYKHIKPDALPPLSKGTEYAGFVLSCKLAAEEISHVATQHYREYLKEFERLSEERLRHTFTLTAPKQVLAVQTSPFAHLRRVNVKVDLEDCNCCGSLEATDAWCMLFAPLYVLFLDDIHIHFMASSSLLTRRKRDGLDKVHCIVQNVLAFIESRGLELWLRIDYNAFHPQSTQHELEYTQFLNDFETRASGYTQQKRVNAKGICFSWDCREVAQKKTPVTMMGLLWRHTLRLRDSDGMDEQLHHRVADVNHYAGEIRIASSARWAPTTDVDRSLLYTKPVNDVALQMKDLEFGEAATIVSKVVMSREEKV